MPNEDFKMKVNKDLDVNIKYLKNLLGVGKTFDIIFREYKVGNRKAASFSVNGMTNDILLSNIFQEIIAYNQDELSVATLQKVFYSRAVHSQVKLVEGMHDALVSLLSGEMLFFLDKEEQVIVLDARAMPGRSPSESSIEKVTRGSKDSFVETLPFNTTLIRRRLRDPNLRFEVVPVGARSQSSIAVAYIEDIVNPKLVETVKSRLNEIVIDGIPMASKAIEEYIVRGSRWNPLPKVRYTERPDVAATHLLEGHVCVIVDTSPNVIILPTTFWHHVQHAEEYHQNPLVGTYLRLVRLFGVILSLVLPPLWLTFVTNHHLLPESLAFLGPRDPGIVPLAIQFILAEIGLDLLRMATIHVPTPQSAALGFIGAIMLGEFSVKVGLFGIEIIYYTAIAAIGAFATPSIELSMAMRLFRIFLLTMVILFRLPGFFIGLLAVFLIILCTKSFHLPYLWPLLPFNFSAMMDVVFRLPLPDKTRRPAALRPQDKDRQEE